MTADDSHTSPTGHPPPRLKAPAHACDTHLHFYGPKFSRARHRVPPPAAQRRRYRKPAKAARTERAVIVQPSAYGKDNRCTLEGIAALGTHKARGIAVFDTSSPMKSSRALTRPASAACGT